MHGAQSGAAKSAVLGVDVGTSAVKCVVVDGARILATATAPLQVLNPKPGWSEQAPADWIEAAKTAIQTAIPQAGLHADAILGIGLSGQMHGAVPLDAVGHPLRPAILWNDNRATAQCAQLGDAVPKIGEISGIGPLPGFSAPKLMWMRDYEPALFDQIRQILLPKDYLAFWMTGQAVTDFSDAAGTMWLDQRTRTWSAQVADASGIDLEWLPPLKCGFDTVGALRAGAADALGLPPGIAIFAGGGDAAAGALSMGAAEAGKCFLSLGTSGQLLVVDDHYAPDPEKFVHAYCHTLPGTWFRMAAMLNGARPLAWFAGVLGKSVAELLSLAETCDRTRIPLFLPYLTGERSPHGDPDIRGAFYGLDDASGAPEMARAVIEAVAFSMGDAKASFGPSFAPDGAIPVIGGGARSDAVLGVLADVLQHPVSRAQAGEGGAALGAALLAEVGLGLRSQGELVFDPPLGETFMPRHADDLHSRLSRFRALYQQLKPLTGPR